MGGRRGYHQTGDAITEFVIVRLTTQSSTYRTRACAVGGKRSPRRLEAVYRRVSYTAGRRRLICRRRTEDVVEDKEPRAWIGCRRKLRAQREVAMRDDPRVRLGAPLYHPALRRRPLTISTAVVLTPSRSPSTLTPMTVVAAHARFHTNKCKGLCRATRPRPLAACLLHLRIDKHCRFTTC